MATIKTGFKYEYFHNGKQVRISHRIFATREEAQKQIDWNYVDSFHGAMDADIVPVKVVRDSFITRYARAFKGQITTNETANTIGILGVIGAVCALLVAGGANLAGDIETMNGSLQGAGIISVIFCGTWAFGIFVGSLLDTENPSQTQKVVTNY